MRCRLEMGGVSCLILVNKLIFIFYYYANSYFYVKKKYFLKYNLIYLIKYVKFNHH